MGIELNLRLDTRHSTLGEVGAARLGSKGAIRCPAQLAKARSRFFLRLRYKYLLCHGRPRTLLNLLLTEFEPDAKILSSQLSKN